MDVWCMQANWTEDRFHNGSEPGTMRCVSMVPCAMVCVKSVNGVFLVSTVYYGIKTVRNDESVSVQLCGDDDKFYVVDECDFVDVTTTEYDKKTAFINAGMKQKSSIVDVGRKKVPDIIVESARFKQKE